MADLHARLANLSLPDDEQGAWQPVFFDLSNGDERQGLEALLDGGRVRSVHDCLDNQLEDLAKIRNPSVKGPRLQELERELLGDTPRDEFGVWVYYPWSGRVVHVIGREDYLELRADRNRNKITREEQAKLASLRVGVVGLSVGQATALTLTMEGVGGIIRLADFDILSASNLNRLRAGVHDLEVPKVFITAREIFEINPFAQVEIYGEGITEDNLDAFLGDPEPLDLLFEECDDLQVKILLREHAKAHRIPVLMETSDRGMLDIERFDLEPDRPLLHGLIGDLKAEELKGLTTYEKVPTVLRMIGPTTMSKRMSGSLIDVESSLASWPQLASGVALGGAIITDVARRIALGDLTISGRYYVDPEELINDEVPSREVYVPPFTIEPVDAQPEPAPTLAPVKGAGPSTSQIRDLVSCGIMAPSGGNCQPWRFEYTKGRLRCIHDVSRSRGMLDYGNNASYLAFGAVVENIELAAATMGLATTIEPFPSESDAAEVCWLSFAPTQTPPSDELCEYIATRVSNRRLSERQPLPEGAEPQLRAAAELYGARFQLTENPEHLDRLAEVLGRGEKIRLLSQTLHQEMMSEVRWSAEEAAKTRDGLDLQTLELTPTDLAGMQLLSSWPLMKLVREIGGGEGLERPTRKAVAAASAVGLVSAAGTSPADYFTAGRAVQRVWLTATKLGLAFQPMTALMYLFARMVHGEGKGFDSEELDELKVLRTKLGRVFEIHDDRAEAMVFRLAQAGAPSARSLRVRVEDVLTLE